VKRAALFCPGRGSYTEKSLGTLPEDHFLVRQADEIREEFGLRPLVELDAENQFSASLHLTPSNVSPLTFVISYIDGALAMSEHRVVCVGGNSLGWYSALAVSGALSFEEGFRLVQEMAILQQEHAEQERGGGQLVYPVVGDDWRPDPERRAAVDAALEARPEDVFPSVHLGGYEVLAATEEGLAYLNEHLPLIKTDTRTYPLRLFKHGPYHTQLQSMVSEEAFERLSSLHFRAPKVPLIDGAGRQYLPHSANPDELRVYTLGEQVVCPYDFTTSVRVALREYAPDCLVLAGPGNTLGGVCGQITVAEGYRDLHTREAMTDGEGADFILSMRR